MAVRRTRRTLGSDHSIGLQSPQQTPSLLPALVVGGGEVDVVWSCENQRPGSHFHHRLKQDHFPLRPWIAGAGPLFAVLRLLRPVRNTTSRDTDFYALWEHSERGHDLDHGPGLGRVFPSPSLSTLCYVLDGMLHRDLFPDHHITKSQLEHVGHEEEHSPEVDELCSTGALDPANPTT